MLTRQTVSSASSIGVFVLLAAGVSRAQTVERASVSSLGVQDNTGASTASYVTPDGRFVVFQSTADNLVPGDTGDTDVFIRDRWLGTTSLVSVPDPGTGNANASGYLVESIGAPRSGVRYCSDDGRHVVFVSSSNTLVNNDTNGDPPWHISGTDVFVRDRDLDNDGIFDEPGVGNTRTVRVSVKTNGSQYTEFVIGQDTYGGGVSNPSISATGRFVAFESQADVLTTGNEQGTIGSNIYWHDRDNDGLGDWDQIGPVCITAPPFCLTAQGSVTELVSKVRCCSGAQFDSFCEHPAISGDGRFVAFATTSKWLDYNFNADDSPFGDENNRKDVYVRNMWTGSQAVRVSLDSSDQENNDQGSDFPSLSHDGRFVAFTSPSSQLVSGDNNNVTDVFVRDRDNDENNVYDELGSNGLVNRTETYRVSLGYSDGNSVQLNGSSGAPSISADGRHVAFTTEATNGFCFTFCFPSCNLVCLDSAGNSDIFIRDTVAGSTARGSITANGGIPNADCTQPAVANDGQTLAFVSGGTDIVTPDANGSSNDVYVVVPPPSVVAQYLFYHNSAWADVPVPDSGPGGKPALLPGQTATFANVSSFRRGINGIYIDVAALPGIPVLADFSFRTGNNNSPGSWPAAANPVISLLPGAGLGGAQRIKLVWSDNAIPNKSWLQVTVKATANTGLAADHVFYYGLLMGETGDDPSPPLRFLVTSTDYNNCYNNRSLTPVLDRLISDPFDFDRSKNVNSTDYNNYCYNVRSLGPTDGLLVITP